MSVRELRPELLKQCDILQAILAFNYALTAESKEKIDLARTRIPVAVAKELREIRDRLHDSLKQYVKLFGCVKKPSTFAAEFIVSSKTGWTVPNALKAAIDRAYFTNFCAGDPLWQTFPPHLRLQVHFDWVVVPDHLIFHYWLPEAVMYEDMALAFNCASEVTSGIKNLGYLKGGSLAVKKQQMHLRTAVLSAYYFVEAYLNGIAFDYDYRNQGSLSQSEKDLLMEWDSPNNRQKYLSFERKIKEYPKIILKRSEPPLTITNCKELALLLGDAKELRDAIVHQSSKTLDIKLIPAKVRWLQSVSLEKVQEVLDATVGFVMKLNAVLGTNGIQVGWLHPRDPSSGLFPPSAFE
jgi:hypothetical protein